MTKDFPVYTTYAPFTPEETKPYSRWTDLWFCLVIVGITAAVCAAIAWVVTR